MTTETFRKQAAINSFLVQKAEIDELLAKLQAASDDFLFGDEPDAITWGHVGSAGEIANHLRRAVEALGE